MGNWRTVNLRGQMAEADIEKANEFLNPGEDYRHWTCMSFSSGLAGLGHWPAEVINADGNLSERDYSVDDVAETLRDLVKVAPSLELKVHCGGEYESEECLATVTVANGEVSIGAPEVPKVKAASMDSVMGRLFGHMHGGPSW